MIIGITGGIGSGKSRVTDFFAAQYGISIIDADAIARQLLQPPSAVLNSVAQAFPQAFENGVLNRATLRALIFNDEALRLRLNAIMHPAIRQALLLALQSASQRPYCILSAPLLLENQLQNLVDAICVVDVSEKTQIQRASQRDGVTAAEIEAIMARQWSRPKRLAWAHYVIDNEADWAATEVQLSALHRHWSLLEALPAAGQH